MNNLIFLEKEMSLVEMLNSYYFELGILQEDKYIKININILNTDDTISKYEMPLNDVMYLTENGTMTIPGKHTFENALRTYNYILEDKISNLVDDILNNKIATKSEVEIRLNELALNIQDYLRNYMSSYVTNANKVNDLLDIKDSNKYLYNLNSLSKYIKCKVQKYQ